MSDETTLLPCPWCGGEADVAEFMTRCDCMRFYKVVCNDCHCMGANINMWYCSEAEAIAAWNTRTHGTLTAEQVHDAIERHITFYEGGDYDEQAIADELNAKLGNGTCENKAKHWGEFECSECGFYADFGSDLHRVNRCPDCGKAVK